MPLRVNNLRLAVEQPEASLRDTLAETLGVCPADVSRWRILRKSLDARSRHDLAFVYSAAVELGEDEQRVFRSRRDPRIESYEPPRFDDPPPGQEPLPERPVIVGSGPAGLLAAYYLALRGYRPLVLERGEAVKNRVPAIRAFDRGGEFDRENNYLFGEGGAGTFSDGKLTCRMSGPDVEWVLERFIECGGKPEIRYEYRPHLGSNRLPLLVRNFRRQIEALGGEYRFGCRVEGLDIGDGRVRGLSTSSGHIAAGAVVLAIGHSARDTYEMLHRLAIPMQARAFQLGLRIEQPQEQVNRHKYGQKRYLDLLGAADYTLVARGQPDLYTFCMCAGGVIIPSVSEPEMFCTNGMSNSRHDTPWANSGLVVTLDPQELAGDHPLAGVEVQRRYESAAYRLAGRNYYAPIQRAADFLARRAPEGTNRLQCSYRRGTRPLDLEAVLPGSVAAAIRSGLPIMDRKWRGDFLKNAILVGPEMRGSSPVRISRDPATRECPGVTGMFPVGEGAGYAGGIISAAVDGLRTAKSIVGRWAPLTT
jgi:uncharacterized FAD-dependent dehydrogenase